MRWIAKTFVFAGAGVVLGLCLSFYYFGSLGSALAYAKGDRLIPDRRVGTFGTVERGRSPVVAFDLTNTSRQRITILGAKTLCTCVLVEDLPLTVPPMTRRSISVAVDTKARNGPVQEPVYLFTDFPSQAKLELAVRGRVLIPRKTHDAAASK
jgi:hypothetical protein